MSDAEITQTVHRFLVLMLDDVDAVRVEVEQGVVYLEGVAASMAQKRAIQQSIAGVPGVRHIINCLSLEHVADLHGALPLPPTGPATSSFGPESVRPSAPER
ncbi:MAG TPA: BON domain-containing protein [Chloroflexia bacterium]|nr:BON domain-containing protein [Chloroflexia bacterium]